MHGQLRRFKMALTAEQNRSMDNYLYRNSGNYKNGFLPSKRKNEFKRQEKEKHHTEVVLDDALKSIEDSHE